MRLQESFTTDSETALEYLLSFLQEFWIKHSVITELLQMATFGNGDYSSLNKSLPDPVSAEA